MTIRLARYFLLSAVIALSLSSAGCAISEATRNKAAYHYQMGLSYLGENNVTGALVELSEAEKYNPDDPDLLNYLGLAYYRKNKFELAEQKYLRALEIKAAFSEARNNLGVDYLELKRWNDAIYQLKLVTEDIFYQNQEGANINLGLAYFGKGDYPKAISIFRSVISGNPKSARARLNLGKVYFAADRVELAIIEFARAVEISNDYANAHYNLALAYLKTKETKAAAAAFHEVLRIAPDSEIGQLSREYIDLLK